jgi:hypothetical protein
MNWGYKIAAVYLGFVLFMGFMVYMCLQQKDINLVSPNYYQNEIVYQKIIDKKNNALKLSSAVKINYSESYDSVELKFPTESANSIAEATFYRPDDAKKDYTVKLNLINKSTEIVSVKGLSKGNWTLKLNWSKDGVEFYQENKIKI